MDREQLHRKLCAFYNTQNVYFQPPANLELKYPCVVYKLNKLHTSNADDNVYFKMSNYEFTVICRDPEGYDIYRPQKALNYIDMVGDTIRHFKFCSFLNHFISDNLHHFVFSIYI